MHRNNVIPEHSVVKRQLASDRLRGFLVLNLVTRIDRTLPLWELQANREVIARNVRKLFNVRMDRVLRVVLCFCLIIDSLGGRVRQGRNTP